MTLLDPRFWLMAVVAALAIATGAYFTGRHHEAQSWEAKTERTAREAAETLAQATEDAREVERLLSRSFAALTAQRDKERKTSNETINALRNALRDGVERMFADVVSCGDDAGGGSSTIGNRKTRAQLSPSYAASLIDIADEGDEAIRDLNLCIDKYNAVRDAVNKKADKGG